MLGAVGEIVNRGLAGARRRGIVFEVEVIAAAMPGRHCAGHADRHDARKGLDPLERPIPEGRPPRPVAIRSSRQRDPHRDQVVRVEPRIHRAQVKAT